MHFDPVHARFDLFVDLSNDLVRCVDDPRITACALVGEQSRRSPAHALDQHIAPGSHSGSFNNASFDGVSKIYPDIEHTVGVKKAGESGAQHFLRVDPGDQRRESIAPMEKELVVAVGVVKANVAVTVYESW